MRRLLLLVLALAASPAAAQGPRSVPSGCQEDFLTCREDCAIEYGGSKRTLAQLTRCMGECQQTRSVCAERHSSLKAAPGGTGKGAPDADPEPRRGRGAPEAEARPAARAPAPAAEPAPAPAPQSEGVTRQGVYQASEAEAETEPESAPFPPLESEKDEEEDPLLAEEPPPPPPPAAKQPAPVTPAHPAPPPEPRKDISEWDPDGD